MTTRFSAKREKLEQKFEHEETIKEKRRLARLHLESLGFPQDKNHPYRGIHESLHPNNK